MSWDGTTSPGKKLGAGDYTLTPTGAGPALGDDLTIVSHSVGTVTDVALEQHHISHRQRQQGQIGQPGPHRHLKPPVHHRGAGAGNPRSGALLLACEDRVSVNHLTGFFGTTYADHAKHAAFIMKAERRAGRSIPLRPVRPLSPQRRSQSPYLKRQSRGWSSASPGFCRLPTLRRLFFVGLRPEEFSRWRRTSASVGAHRAAADQCGHAGLPPKVRYGR